MNVEPPQADYNKQTPLSYMLHPSTPAPHVHQSLYTEYIEYMLHPSTPAPHVHQSTLSILSYTLNSLSMSWSRYYKIVVIRL